MSFTAERSFVDWTGKTTEGGLRVLRLVSRRPVAYAAKCVKCGTESTEPHSRIAYAECRSAVCKAPLRKKERLDEERDRRVERERRALEEENRLAELRMAQETADYAKPVTRPPVAGNDGPATERQRLERRAWAEEMEREEQERQRPIRAAEAQLQETHRKIAKVQRDILTNPKVQDVDIWIDPMVAGASMPISEAQNHNVYHIRLFAEEHPNIAATERNAELIVNYFAKNDIGIFTCSMIEKLHEKLQEAGIGFDEKPAPEHALDYSKRPDVPLRIAPPSKPEPVVYQGFDLETGEPRTYGAREVDKMSSEQMRKALQMNTRGELELPRIGPGPKGSKG